MGDTQSRLFGVKGATPQDSTQGITPQGSTPQGSTIPVDRPKPVPVTAVTQPTTVVSEPTIVTKPPMVSKPEVVAKCVAETQDSTAEQQDAYLAKKRKKTCPIVRAYSKRKRTRFAPPKQDTDQDTNQGAVVYVVYV
jgi:hypothetical protein